MKRLMLVLLLLALAGCGEVSRPGQRSQNVPAEQATDTPAAAPPTVAVATSETLETPAAAEEAPTAQKTAGPGRGFQTWPEAPAMTIDAAKSYTATIKTEKGDIVVRLLPEQAPITVNNFVFLAREGYYEGSTFHRVLPGFMAQGGDPTGTGAGGPGYTIPDELSAPMTFDRAGLVAMAKTAEPNSAGSQFFITLAPASHLDDKYTIFGEVVEGMDVVEQITPRDPSMGGNLPPGDEILAVTIEGQ